MTKCMLVALLSCVLVLIGLLAGTCVHVHTHLAGTSIHGKKFHSQEELWCPHPGKNIHILPCPVCKELCNIVLKLFNKIQNSIMVFLTIILTIKLPFKHEGSWNHWKIRNVKVNHSFGSYFYIHHMPYFPFRNLNLISTRQSSLN